jgi:CheY-like chemotaxis protein
MALVLHEMTTNAAKHGALSVPAGRLRVSWVLAADGSCTITWVESGGPSVVRDGNAGLGLTLISRLVPHELHGRTDLEFARTGLRATIWLPAECLDVHPVQTIRAIEPRLETSGERPLDGVVALVVDDSLIVSLHLERALNTLGAANVAVAGTLQQALAIVDTRPVNLALLDINLNGEASYAVADRLAERAIPFVFVTGYGRDARLPARFADVPLLAKPVAAHQLAEAIVQFMRPRGDRSS